MMFRIPIVNNEPICSFRATVITFIIVIVIILAAATAVGIVFGTIKSQENSSGTGSGNNNQNLCKYFFPFFDSNVRKKIISVF